MTGKLGIVFVLASVLCYVIAVFVPTPNMDMALHFDFARRMVQGQVPYVDFMDMNFPLIWLLYAPGAWLWSHAILTASAALGLSHFAMSVLFIASMYHAARVLVRENVLESGWFLSITSFILLFPLYQMHQRDHVGLMYMLPYVLLRGTATPGQKRPKSTSSYVFIASVAAIGFNVKPHFLALWVVLELMWWVRNKRVVLDVGHIVITSFTGLYVALILVFTPHILDSVELATAAYTNNLPLTHFLFAPASLFLVVLSLLLIAFKRRLPLHPLTLPLLALAWVGLFIAWMQRVGTSYHYLCALGFGCCALGVQVWVLLQNVDAPWRIRIHRILWISGIAIVLVVGLCHATDIFSKKFDDRRMTTLLGTIAAEKAKDHISVNNLCPLVFPHSPAFFVAGAQAQNPFSCLWFLRSMYYAYQPDARGKPYRDTSAMSTAERRAFRMVVRNAVRDVPDVFMVPSDGIELQNTHVRLSVLDYYSQDSSFKELIGNYSLRDRSDGVDVLVHR